MWLQFDILNPAFDYFFSVSASLAFIMAGFIAILMLFKQS